MKILFFTKYGQLGASSRYRTYQFLDGYRANGLNCTSSSFFNDAYLKSKYKNKKTPVLWVLWAFFKRFLLLFTIFRYDLVVIEKELFPYFPAWPEKLLQLLGRKFVVDYDDALFHQYDNHSSKWVRKFLGKKIAKVMCYSSMVVAGNRYLADYAKRVGAKNISIVHTVIDLKRYPKNFNVIKNKKPVIGWIGSPSTVKYIYDLLPVFERLNEHIPIALHIVGASLDCKTSFDIHSIPWSDGTEVKSMQQFDVGIMPLHDLPWERGKCGFKLIQYMGCSKPVVASPVGVNTEIVEHGKNGFLVSSDKDWLDSFLYLLSDENVRIEMGELGRKKVAESYCLESAIDQLLESFKV